MSFYKQTKCITSKEIILYSIIFVCFLKTQFSKNSIKHSVLCLNNILDFKFCFEKITLKKQTFSISECNRMPWLLKICFLVWMKIIQLQKLQNMKNTSGKMIPKKSNKQLIDQLRSNNSSKKRLTYICFKTFFLEIHFQSLTFQRNQF